MSLDLQYRERPPREGSEGKPVCLVLLHGYGSSELDLLSLADSLDPRLHVVSVRAPHAIGSQEFAWFELDWSTGTVVPDQAAGVESLRRLKELLRRLPERVGSQEKLFVAGFSQGAMMTLGVALEAPEVLARAAMMSGTVLPAFLPTVEDRRLEGISALVQHGLRDQVLAPEGSEWTVTALEKYGAQVKHVEYDMGHEVSAESLRDLKEFLTP